MVSKRVVSVVEFKFLWEKLRSKTIAAETDSSMIYIAATNYGH